MSRERLPLVIDTDGSARMRGRAHGEALRSQIQAALGRWRDETAQVAASAFDAYLNEWLAQTEFVATIMRYVPDALEEVRGIAEGANAPFEQVLGYNLMDEQWWYDRQRSLANRSAAGCSTLAVRQGAAGRPLLAQNMDLPPDSDGAQVVLRVREADKLEVVLLTRAGMIGLCGVNSAGLGVCVNTLIELRPSAAGLPVAFVLRAVLAQHTLADAVAVLRSVPHASGQSYTLASPDGIAGYECSAGGAVAYNESSDLLAHTNHALVSTDWGSLAGGQDMAVVGRSGTRLETVNKALGGIATLDDCERLLAEGSAPICRSRGNDRSVITFGAMCAELSARPVVRIALGPPDETPFMPIAFRVA